ncbi:MAG: biotin-dependent carboxyltransferase family protein [Porticoccaceae bacterium]
MSRPGFLVERPGVMTLIQDAGRIGYHRLGLTTGGPADPLAFDWANRLCGNTPGASALEITVGGLVLRCEVATRMALCGADMPVSINGKLVDSWCSHRVVPGDRIEVGFARSGVRAYLAVSGGFDIPHTLGSAATVVRESLGGLYGSKLAAGDELPCGEGSDVPLLKVPKGYRPVYGRRALLRVMAGYQHDAFPVAERQRFFAGEYRVSTQCDRMGYRLEGPPIHFELPQMLSEGICLGAIQVPPDGQPIVLMCDRQTIGGYPKLGSVLSVDLVQLAQLPPGSKVAFTAISTEEARQIRIAATRQFQQLEPELC